MKKKPAPQPTPQPTPLHISNCNIQSPNTGFNAETAACVTAIAKALEANARAAEELSRVMQKCQPQNWYGIYIAGADS